MNLYEILVPTLYGDTLKPIPIKLHKKWDSEVIKMTGGMTILSPAKGKWNYKGVAYPDEKVIPVRIACELKDIESIVLMTLRLYRQKAVMYYLVSEYVRVLHA